LTIAFNLSRAGFNLLRIAFDLLRVGFNLLTIAFNLSRRRLTPDYGTLHPCGKWWLPGSTHSLPSNRVKVDVSIPVKGRSDNFEDESSEWFPSLATMFLKCEPPSMISRTGLRN